MRCLPVPWMFDLHLTSPSGHQPNSNTASPYPAYNQRRGIEYEDLGLYPHQFYSSLWCEVLHNLDLSHSKSAELFCVAMARYVTSKNDNKSTDRWPKRFSFCLKRYRSDAKASLIGRLLIRKWITTNFYLANDAVVLSRTERGRPCSPQVPPGYDFNVSHAGDYVVFAAGEFGISLISFGKLS